jgi:hypothetical protein
MCSIPRRLENLRHVGRFHEAIVGHHFGEEWIRTVDFHALVAGNAGHIRCFDRKYDVAFMENAIVL